MSKGSEIRQMRQGDHRIQIRVGGLGTRDASCSCGWYAASTGQRHIEEYAQKHIDSAYHSKTDLTESPTRPGTEASST